LISYASAYLKAHHHGAFTCCLLNNYPMGFYRPATLVTDAARHGVRCLPVDVNKSGWLCSVEGREEVRLGLKFVAGLRREVAHRIERVAPFASLADFQTRVVPNQSEMVALAEIGALGVLGGTRREVLWQAEAIGNSGALFANVCNEGASPLPEMSEAESAAADFNRTGICTGPHPMAFVRHELVRLGVVTTAALGDVPDGRRAEAAGVVIVCQRPVTAKGFVFITIEDETGFANAIVTPQGFDRWRAVIRESGALIIGGAVQNRDGVVTIKADGLRPIPLS